MEESAFRLVIVREKNADGQMDLFTGDDFIYCCILSNDHDSDEKEIVVYYNNLGTSEKTLEIQNNDFDWNHQPCSGIHHNTVESNLSLVKNVCGRLRCSFVFMKTPF
jgi:hypothetical protein